MEEFDVIEDFANPDCTVDVTLERLRRFQIHEVNRNRKCNSEYHHLFPILRKYEEKFKSYTRMSVGTFDYILSKVHDSLLKDWCNLHSQPIVPEEKLVVTLRLLATGQSYSSLSFSFRMGTSTICDLVIEVMDVLWKQLYPIHMPIPTEEHLFDIAQDFYLRWDFPHCIGAIDSRHVRIKKPPNSGSLYFNYKKFFSIMLQAVVDARYKFIAIDVGGYGHQHDSTTFKNSGLYKALQNKKIKIPEADELPKSRAIVPYFFIGDGAYPIQDHLMKPYPGKQLPADKSNFNKRLSRALATVECAFGRLCQKWRIFYTTIQQLPETAQLIVKAACVLYNTILDKETESIDIARYNLNETATVFLPNESDCDDVTGTGQEVRNILPIFTGRLMNNKTAVFSVGCSFVQCNL